MKRFFNELTTRFSAKGGDVAEAYVVAHEVGHHVQNQLGVLGSDSSETQQGAINVKLQADCFVGIWANSIKNMGVLEINEIVEAVDAAASVGDDRIQQRVRGSIDPETWTHGSSAQRVAAFTKGFDTGDIQTCDLTSFD